MAEPRPWHLPGYADSEDSGLPSSNARHESTGRTGRSLRTPRLTAAEAGAVAHTVRSAALSARERLTFEETLVSVSRAALRLSDFQDSLGREAHARLSEWLGWSSEAVRSSIAGMAREWDAGTLEALVQAELGSVLLPGVFARDPSAPARRRRAVGPPLTLQINAGNVPGISVTEAILCLLSRSGVLAKTAVDEPWLLPLFATALSEEDPLLGSSIAATWWPGDDPSDTFDTWVKVASKVFVFGGDDAVRSVRGRAPAQTEVIVYGPRLGLAVFLPDAAVEDASSRLARDVATYEQMGCVSPRLVIVVGSNPLEAAGHIATGLEEMSARVPPPRVTETEAVALRAARAMCEFEGLEDGTSVVFGPADLSWSVLARKAPGIAADSLPRAVWVYGIESVRELEALLAPLEGRIQSLGLAGTDGAEEVAELGSLLGVSRVCPVGEMAWPPADWRHDGRHRLLPYLRWTDWESGS